MAAAPDEGAEYVGAGCNTDRVAAADANELWGDTRIELLPPLT